MQTLVKCITLEFYHLYDWLFLSRYKMSHLKLNLESTKITSLNLVSLEGPRQIQTIDFSSISFGINPLLFLRISGEAVLKRSYLNYTNRTLSILNPSEEEWSLTDPGWSENLASLQSKDVYGELEIPQGCQGKNWIRKDSSLRYSIMKWC